MNEFFQKVKEFVIKNKKAVIITSAAVLAAVAVLIAVLLLIGGGKEPDVDPTDPTSQNQPAEEKVAYQVTVKNQIGNAVSNVSVSIYADSTLSDMVWFGKTDENGVVSFDAKAGDGYVAVLEGMAAGYAVADTYAVQRDTQIVLSAAGSSINEVEGALAVGDPVPNFTVTTLDGTTYTLSDLIAEGKPVILNFWYENCEPCKAEFPHMQEAYAEFTDEAVLLALNLDDSEEQIRQYQQTSGVDLPFAVGDACWKTLLKIYANPTTAVIDRYGHLSVVHTGTLPDTQVFTNLFAFYTSANYQHTTLQTIDDLVAGVPGETPENPLEFSGAESYRITLMPDQTIYCAFYRVDGMLMSIANENVSVTYNGQTYTAVDGWVKLVVNSPDPFTPVNVAIANLGGQKDFDVDFSYVPGSMGAPHELVMGPVTTEIAAGNDQGVYYTYTGTANGKLTVAVTGATEGVEYNCVLFNQTTGTMVSSQDAVADPETGVLSISVDVNANDVVQLVASTMMDANFEFPAATLNLEVSFADGEGTVAYLVTVVDKNDFPIPGVSLTITGNGVDMDITTGADGVASVALTVGTYTVVPNIPLGYQAEATSFEISDAEPALVIVLENVGGQSPDPTDPVVKPTDPVVKPTDPVVKPTDPVVKPTDPVVKPTDPVVKPTDPVVKPTDPVVKPTDPVVKPTDPVVKPTEPTKPTYTPDPEVEGETRENPLYGKGNYHVIEVKAGYTIYLDILMDSQEKYLEVSGGDFALIINAPTNKNAETLYSENGKVSQSVSPEGIGLGHLCLDLTNTTDEDQTYTINLYDPLGSYMNPEELQLGDFTLKVKRGNEKGYNYIFTAPEDGVLTISCTKCTSGVVYGLTIDKQSVEDTAQSAILSTDGNTVSMEVKAGEQLRITVGSIENDLGPYPKATFELNASFEEA